MSWECFKCKYSLEALRGEGTRVVTCPECGETQQQTWDWRQNAPMTPRIIGAAIAQAPMVLCFAASFKVTGWATVGLVVYILPISFGISFLLGIISGVVLRHRAEQAGQQPRGEFLKSLGVSTGLSILLGVATFVRCSFDHSGGC